MDLQAEILREHSKRQALRIARWVGADSNRFAQLMELFLHGEYRITQRSSWIVSLCADMHPSLIDRWLGPMIRRMEEPGVHVAVKRNVVRILQFVEIPRNLMGKVAALCFQYLESPDAAIAVKANAMSVLMNIAQREPDLRRELQTIIERMMPYVGVGLQARGRIVLKRLRKDEKKSQQQKA